MQPDRLRSFVSITRLRLRSFRYVLPFFLDTNASLKQATSAEGFLHGALLNDRNWTFWTATAWDGEASMRHYMRTGPHLRAMPKLMDWCDEASVVHWHQDGDALPGWGEAARRMRAEGRTSKVRHPGRHHADMSFAEPRTTGGLRFAPRR